MGLKRLNKIQLRRNLGADLGVNQELDIVERMNK